MTDLCAQLRADLLSGRWQRLTDPLLPVLLLEDASWWPRAHDLCAYRMIDDALDIPPQPWFTYGPHVLHQRIAGVLVERTLTAFEAAEDVILWHRHERPDLMESLVVLERYHVD